MKEMEAIFAELVAEDGPYQLSLGWITKYVPGSLPFLKEEDPKKDTFDYEEFRISWEHAANLKHPDTPVVLICWNSNYREDSWDENEREVDATAEDIASFVSSQSLGFPDDRGVPDRLEEMA